MSLLGELKRRNVFRVATFYVVASWLLLQAGTLLFDMLGIPAWGMKFVFGLLVLGFPLVLVFSWVYELTPEGLKREYEVERHQSITALTGRRLDILTIAMVAVAIGLLLANRFAGGNKPDAMYAADAAVTQTTSKPGTANTSTSATVQASIAVLPFVNMSDEKANEYFSDGLTEELLNVLANVQGLRVIARTSSFAYKGKEVKIADVARELDVAHVLEGSVRKAGSRVRITAQLIRAKDSSHLWSETYDRDLNDIFAVQDEISNQVVDALKVRLLPGESRHPDVGGTTNPKAYEAYLLGKYFRTRGESEEDLRKSLAAFDNAVQLDSRYAQAHAGRADTLNALASYAYLPFESGFEQARQAAERAVEIAPELAEAHGALGDSQYNSMKDLSAAAESFERALQLNPGSAQVQQRYSLFANSLGRHEAAIQAAQRSVALDPVAPGAYRNLAMVLLFAHRYADAEGAARRALELQPDRAGGHYGLGQSLLYQGRFEEALAAFSAEPLRWGQLTGTALAHARSGQTEAARRALGTLQLEFGNNVSYQCAQIEAQLGDRDAAMKWLEFARATRDPGITDAYVDPALDPLRDDPRFQRMLADLGFDVQKQPVAASR